MTDRAFDFDELDKAVNSLMGSKPAKKSVSDAEEKTDENPDNTVDLGDGIELGTPDTDENTLDLSDIENVTVDQDKIPDENASSAPEYNEPDPDENDDQSDESSDDDLAESDQEKIDEEKEPESEAEPESEPEAEPEPEPKYTPRPVSRPASGRHMDIVRSPGNMRVGKTISPVTVAPVVRPEVAPDPVENEIPEEDMPQTPFLPNANQKIEKRPLGNRWPFGKKASSSTEPESSEPAIDAEEPEAVEPELISEEPETSGEEPETRTDDQEPADSDVMDDPTTDGKENAEVESTDTEPELTPEEANKARELQEVESKELESLEQKLEEEEEKEPTIRDVESGDTGRILEGSERAETQTISDNKSAAIYDTTEYHQPLNHPAKRRSGIGIVIAIILIIAICVALAAAAYFILGIGI